MGQARQEVERDYEEYKQAGRVWGQVPLERIAKIKFPRPAKEVIEQFELLDDLTTTVSDVLEFARRSRCNRRLPSSSATARQEDCRHRCYGAIHSRAQNPNPRLCRQGFHPDVDS